MFCYCVQKFLWFLNEANNCHKLSKIEEIENFISFDDIVDIQGDFVDFKRDVREQSNVVDGKLMFKVISEWDLSSFKRGAEVWKKSIVIPNIHKMFI